MRQSRQVRIACLGVLAALELLLSSLWTLKLNVITLWVKKTGPFLLCPRPRRGGGGIIGGHRRLSPVRLSVWCFEHNFGKYCPILIILSLLQTEIISYDNVYYKIYHHTSNLPVHYLAKWSCQRCWHDFVIKDATVKQVTWIVTDMDLINGVSSQAVLKMPSFSMDTHWMSSSSLVNK